MYTSFSQMTGILMIIPNSKATGPFFKTEKNHTLICLTLSCDIEPG